MFSGKEEKEREKKEEERKTRNIWRALTAAELYQKHLMNELNELELRSGIYRSRESGG